MTDELTPSCGPHRSIRSMTLVSQKMQRRQVTPCMNRKLATKVWGQPSSVRDLGRTLGACLGDVPELRKEIPSLLRELDEELQLESECAIELRGSILDALKRICEDKNKLSVHVGEIADRSNAILEERGEIQVLSAK